MFSYPNLDAVSFRYVSISSNNDKVKTLVLIFRLFVQLEHLGNNHNHLSLKAECGLSLSILELLMKLIFEMIQIDLSPKNNTMTLMRSNKLER